MLYVSPWAYSVKNIGERHIHFYLPFDSSCIHFLDIVLRTLKTATPYCPLIAFQSTSSTPASSLARLISSIIPSGPSICGGPSFQLTRFSVWNRHPLYHDIQATLWKHSTPSAKNASNVNSATWLHGMWLGLANAIVVQSHTLLHIDNDNSAVLNAIVLLTSRGFALWNVCRNWWVRKAWMKMCTMISMVVVI
jgi:hypothetical protein